MRVLHAFLVVLLSMTALSGCEDKYQKGYSAGYTDGVTATENRLNAIIDRQKREIANLETTTSSSPSSIVTEVCGDGGVNLNGKYYEPGKTGCVRVYSDGRVTRY